MREMGRGVFAIAAISPSRIRRKFGLGTLAVRTYVTGYSKPRLIEGGFTGAADYHPGPEGRYGGLLYTEKEGFDPLLEQAQIGARHDLATMSCKGMSVTAARQLVDQTCARYQIPLYTLHDFDISGFTIASTLHQIESPVSIEQTKSVRTSGSSTSG